MKKKLEDLIRRWNQSRGIYLKASLVRDNSNPLDRSRYEGISTGYRWAIEDLQSVLKQKPQTKKPNEKAKGKRVNRRA